MSLGWLAAGLVAAGLTATAASDSLTPGGRGTASRANSTDCNDNGIPDATETDVTFVEHVIAGSVDGVRKVLIADVDGDGDPDALSVSNDDATVAWYPNTDGGGNFGPAEVITSTLIGARSIGVADLDGDGDLDVAAGGVTPSLVDDDLIVWFENTDGSGSFGPAVSIFVGRANPTSIVLGDVDDDGDQDLVYTNLDLVFADDLLAWAENLDGLGDFAEPAVFSTAVDDPTTLAIGDLDGDEDPDVAVTSRGSNEVLWYENVDRAGPFTPPHLVSDSAIGANFVVTSDVDGDGDPDLVATHELGDRIVWYENLDGEGQFGPGNIITTTLDGARSVAAGDLDGDGDPDVVATSFHADRIEWFENVDGLGTFGAASVVSLASDGANWVVADDLDGDGDVDLLASAELDDEVVWFENRSNDCNGNSVPDSCDVASGIDDCNTNGVPDSCELEAGVVPDCNTNDSPDECDIAGGSSTDCTADGIPDECEADCNGNGQADSCDVDSGSSLDCNGNGVPDECEVDCNGNGIPDDCDIAGGAIDDCPNGVPDECEPDCDGNAVPDACDIVSGNAEDCDANGVPDGCDVAAGFDCNENAVPDACDVASGGAADCNANGFPDVCELAAGAPDCNGNGRLDACDVADTFAPMSLANVFNNPRWITSADLDGDGDHDLVAASVSGGIERYENLDGQGSFSAPLSLSATLTAASSVAAGDIDGDGDPDLLASHRFTQNKVVWYENRLDTDGEFGPPTTLGPVTEPRSAILVDVDGDGDLDAAAVSPDDDRILWWRNLDGNGSFGAPLLVSSAVDFPYQVVAADLDADGDLDFASASCLDDGVAWHENLDGNGTFGLASVISTAGHCPLSLFAGDLDGDGDPDVAAASNDDASILWYRNDGGGGFLVQPAVTFMAEEARFVAAADIDGDADLDILVVNDMRVSWHENLDGAATFGPARVITTLPVLARMAHAADLDRDGDADIAAVSSIDVAWYRNRRDDCTNDGIPDVCEPDCDLSGQADSCDLLFGDAVDCNGNDRPDTCDTPCTVGCDTDGDACVDDLDAAPMDPLACADVDSDGCEDCASGVFDPRADGNDADADGVCDPGDCDPGDATVWQPPTAVSTLVLATPGVTSLSWLPPDDPGALVPRYDAIRSDGAQGFLVSGTCVESDGTDTLAIDATSLFEGQVLFYLVRVENGCVGSSQALGTGSDGQPREAVDCVP